MKLSTMERLQLVSMIETQTFYGIPIEEVTQELLEELDASDARILYIIASMLGWDVRDKESYDNYPFEAENYLKKYTLKK